MASLYATGIADLVVTTLRDLGRLRFQQVAQEVQDYEVFPKWFKKDKVAFDSGIGIRRTIQTKTNGGASHVGLLEEDNVNIADTLQQLDVDWRHVRTGWAFIYQESLMNRGRAMVLNIIEPRRADALLSLVDELEEFAWASPASTTSKYPNGVPYWVVMNATTGFNGGLPSGHTTVGGIDVTTHTKFKNYTGTYSNVSRSDLIKSMRTAHRKCRFKSPISIKDYRGGRADRYRIYVNEDVISDLEDEGSAQNENLGRDIAQVDNSIVFRGHPIVWVPILDDETTDPVYMIDHTTFMPVVLKGDFLRESSAIRASNQHDVYQFFIDMSYNYICVDRRRNAVFYKA